MSQPTVSFVVPCYKLGHLLAECVNSILAQTYRDFEVLIMDDCSPDNTPEVARSFSDPRVRYVRNDPNIGSLNNYNKGIKLSRGKYVWLISADDYLRRDYVLQRYVELMEANPRIGYTFCPGMGVKNGKETGLLEYSACGDMDRVFAGHDFVRRLCRWNVVVAASAMARRECYEKISLFPMNDGMTWSGDWYLWCAFALRYDVGYFAEPMVGYRDHELSMTNTVAQKDIRMVNAGNLAVPWMIWKEARNAGFKELAEDCLRAIEDEYARAMTTKNSHWFYASGTFMSREDLEDSLQRFHSDRRERDRIAARIHALVAEHHQTQSNTAAAVESYSAALEKNPWAAKWFVKKLLLSLGRPGDVVLKGVRALR